MAGYSPASIVCVSVALPMLSLIAVYLRFVVRLKVQPTYLGVDDWMIVAAIVFLLADCANLSVAAILGIQGQDFPGKIPEDREMLENKSDYAQVILEKPLYALMKMSVLFFYRRIFSVNKRFLRFNTCVLVLIAAWSFAYMLAEMFQCGLRPWVLWTAGADPGAVCVNRTMMNFTYAITDVIGDMLVVFMPFPVIRKLKIDRRQKMGVAFIFLLGALSTASSIVRLGFISIAFTQDYGAFGVNKHEAGTPPAVWSMVEGAVGVLAACLPPLGPLIRRAPNARKASKDLYHRTFSPRSDETARSGSYRKESDLSDHSSPINGSVV